MTRIANTLTALLLGLPAPALAQHPTLIRDDMPHVELSVGAMAMVGGPGADLEREMREMHLDHQLDRQKMPSTSPPDLLPGWFAQAHAGAARHAMVGLVVSAVETDTVGRAADGGELIARAVVTTGAAMVSFRPNSWLKIGAGPALHRETLSFTGSAGQPQSETTMAELGWLASGEAKFHRVEAYGGRPPRYGYVIAQYRQAASLRPPAVTVGLLGTRDHAVAWPAMTVRYAHWVMGAGVGFEF